MEDRERAARAPDQPDAGVTVAVEWEFRPWRDAPGMAWGAALGLAACGAALVLVALPLLVKAALFVLLGLAVEPALVTSRFRVDEGGVARRTRLGEARLPWSRARHWRRHRRGLEVTSGGRAWLPGDARRVRLFIPERERSRVMAALDERRRDHGG